MCVYVCPCIYMHSLGKNKTIRHHICQRPDVLDLPVDPIRHRAKGGTVGPCCSAGNVPNESWRSWGAQHDHG